VCVCVCVCGWVGGCLCVCCVVSVDERVARPCGCFLLLFMCGLFVVLVCGDCVLCSLHVLLVFRRGH